MNSTFVSMKHGCEADRSFCSKRRTKIDCKVPGKEMSMPPD